MNRWSTWTVYISYYKYLNRISPKIQSDNEFDLLSQNYFLFTFLKYILDTLKLVYCIYNSNCLSIVKTVVTAQMFAL